MATKEAARLRVSLHLQLHVASVLRLGESVELRFRRCSSEEHLQQAQLLSSVRASLTRAGEGQAALSAAGVDHEVPRQVAPSHVHALTCARPLHSEIELIRVAQRSLVAQDLMEEGRHR